MPPLRQRRLAYLGFLGGIFLGFFVGFLAMPSLLDSALPVERGSAARPGGLVTLEGYHRCLLL